MCSFVCFRVWVKQNRVLACCHAHPVIFFCLFLCGDLPVCVCVWLLCSSCLACLVS